MNLVDSCGWLEYCADTPMASLYESAILAKDELLVPTVCIYEVYRRLIFQTNRELADSAEAAMRQGRVVNLDAFTARIAAGLGLEYKLPFADSIILATARAHKATIWTHDAHFRDMPGVRFCEA